MMEPYIVYNSQYKAIICRKHGYAIPPKSIVQHFRNEHKELPIETRKQIINQVQSLEIYEPKDVVIPEERAPSIECLTVRTGYLCTFDGCNTIHGTSKSIERHVSDHMWMNEGGHKWNEIKAQTFFLGKYKR